MTPNYLRQDKSARDRWMVSYLDVLTILLVLFVTMAAKSLHSAPPPPKLTPPARAVAAPPLSPFDPLANKLAQIHLDAHLDPRGLVVSLPQSLLFAPGDDRIDPAALATLKSLSELLLDIPNHIVVVGHADAVPIHNRRFRSNWDLAASRGLRLLEVLNAKFGIDENRLSAESYGSRDPKTSNNSQEGRASNRRVEIVILTSRPGGTP